MCDRIWTTFVVIEVLKKQLDKKLLFHWSFDYLKTKEEILTKLGPQAFPNLLPNEEQGFISSDEE
jgi:hypothetical protein